MTGKFTILEKFIWPLRLDKEVLRFICLPSFAIVIQTIHPTPRPASRSPRLQSLEQSFIHYGWLGLPLLARASALGSLVGTVALRTPRGSPPSQGTEGVE